jgi:hypothetical protein
VVWFEEGFGGWWLKCICVQHVLREANKNTLDHVTAFLQQAAEEET